MIRIVFPWIPEANALATSRASVFALKLAWVVEAILSVWKWNMIEKWKCLRRVSCRRTQTQDEGLFMLFQSFSSMQHDALSGGYLMEEP